MSLNIQPLDTHCPRSTKNRPLVVTGIAPRHHFDQWTAQYPALRGYESQKYHSGCLLLPRGEADAVLHSLIHFSDGFSLAGLCILEAFSPRIVRLVDRTSIRDSSPISTITRTRHCCRIRSHQHIQPRPHPEGGRQFCNEHAQVRSPYSGKITKHG